MKVRVKEDALGGAEEQSIFGQTAEAGEWIEVDDKFADKAKGNPTLEVQGAPKASEPERETEQPRRGRPPGSGSAA